MRTLLALVVFLALSGDAATIKLFTDYPNGVPVGSDFLVYQRNSTFGNASVSQTKSDWFNNPVFTGSGGIQGNWRVDSFGSIGGYLSIGGIYYGDGSGLTNISGTATTTYINNVTNNIFYNTNVAFFNNTYVTNITVEVPGGLINLNLTPLTLMYADVNDAEASLPNAVGVLTNDGSGAIGYSTSLSFDEFDATDAYMTNVFVPYTNALLSTDGNGQLTNAVVSTGLNFSGNALTATGVSSLGPATNEVTRQINSGTNIYASLGTAISDLSLGTNLTYQYKTNAVTTGTLTFGQAYRTNIAADITLNALTLGPNGSAMYESLVLLCTNSDTAVHKITWPSGVFSGGVAAVSWITNGYWSEVLVDHFATLYTNAVTKN